MRGVCHRILASAMDALHTVLLPETNEEAEPLLVSAWAELEHLLKQHGVDETLDGSCIPSVATIHQHSVLAPEGADLCSLSLLPLAYSAHGITAAESPNPKGEAQWLEEYARPPIHFCGASYFAACINLWVNTISNSPPMVSGPPLKVEN